MQLTIVDGITITGYFVFNLAIGIYYRKKATSSISEYLISGRNVSWLSADIDAAFRHW
jgi:solute:Na+ symporter, SSS family